MDGFSKIDKLADDEYYYSPEGYIIFTEKYLLKRGYCCQNGCKHCPYKKPPTPEGGFDKQKR